MLSFTVLGEPRGKGRPRFTKMGIAYTDSETRAYENLVRSAYRRAAQGAAPIRAGVPVEVHITAFFGIPKNLTKREQYDIASGRTRPTKKPDLDNIIKIVCDALNPVKDKKTGAVIFEGAYADDAQVVKAIPEKLYSMTPRVEVTIEPIMPPT
jgi:Holliday junction resolvase RusA-like endonuclease